MFGNSTAARNPLILFSIHVLETTAPAQKNAMRNPLFLYELEDPAANSQSIISKHSIKHDVVPRSLLTGSWLTHGPLGIETVLFCSVPSHVFVACCFSGVTLTG